MTPLTRRKVLRTLGAAIPSVCLWPESATAAWAAAAAASPRDREKAIKYSDVAFAFVFTPEEYKMWHANVLYGWCGHPANEAEIPKYVARQQAALEAGVRMGASISAFAGDREWFQQRDPNWKDALWRDADGNYLMYPWVRPPDPFPPEKGIICTNHPLFLEKKFEEADLAMAVKPYAFHLDDPLGTATVLRAKSPGCFCRYCLAGFREYLQKEVPADRLRALGISELESFDYASFLRGRNDRALWPEFEDFQLTRAVENVGKIIEHARQTRGERISVGANAPVVGWHLVFAPLMDYIAAEVGTDAQEKRFGAKPMLNYKIGEALGVAIAATGIYRDWVRLLIHDIPDLVRGWVAESYALGGNFIVPHKEWGFVQFPGDESTISTAYPGKPEVIGPLYKFVRTYPELFDHYKPVSQVALLYDYRATRQLLGGYELPQTPGRKPAALHEICLELGNANVPFGMVVSGGGPFRHELRQPDLAPYEFVIVNDPLMVEGPQRDLLDAWDRNGKLVRWQGIDSVRSRLETWVAAEPPGEIWALPRLIPERQNSSLVCHVLNRRFDPAAEKLVPQKNVKVRLRKKIFGGRRHAACTLYLEGHYPQLVPLHDDENFVEVTIPYLELWGVLKFS